MKTTITRTQYEALIGIQHMADQVNGQLDFLRDRALAIVGVEWSDGERVHWVCDWISKTPRLVDTLGMLGDLGIRIETPAETEREAP